MAKFLMGVLIADTERYTARLGSASGSANYCTDKEVNKLVKLAGESRFNLCAVGDNIEGYVSSVESASQDDFAIGTVAVDGRMDVLCDGLQATPGTGVLAVGDYVVTGTVTPFGTVLPAAVKVCKATLQPGTAIVLADNVVGTINTGLASLATLQKTVMFAWRVISLGTVGTGAVGTAAVVERVGA